MSRFVAGGKGGKHQAMEGPIDPEVRVFAVLDSNIVQHRSG